MKKGHTMMELLVAIAILAVIAAVVALNLGGFFGRTGGNVTENVTTNETVEPFTICINGECLECTQWRVQEDT